MRVGCSSHHSHRHSLSTHTSSTLIQCWSLPYKLQCSMVVAVRPPSVQWQAIGRGSNLQSFISSSSESSIGKALRTAVFE